MTDRFQITPEVHLILERDQGREVLLLERFQTGYWDGSYSLVAGHLDGRETARAGCVREAKEEAGITIDPADLAFAHLLHRLDFLRPEGEERLSFFFLCSTWTGDPVNREPDKCSDLSWFAYDALPDTMVDYVRHALHAVRDGVTYSEHGWNS